MSDILMKLRYSDIQNGIGIVAYADTIVLEDADGGTYLAAVRIGGYPESVKGMANAINGGGSVFVETEGVTRLVHSHIKRYSSSFSHDGIYAEATLVVKDEESVDDPERGGSRPRRCYLFCAAGDRDQLFEIVDRKTAVPLIAEFRDYVLDELTTRGILSRMKVITKGEGFDAWVLHVDADDKNIVRVVEDGLAAKKIAIPGAVLAVFPQRVRTVSQYLNVFGVRIAERIKNQFEPLFDPAVEPLASEILEVNDHIRAEAGYSLYDAQLAMAEAHRRCLTGAKVTLCIAECGSGKTKIGLTALHAYQQGKCRGGHFNLVLCPSHMTKKWVREVEETVPDSFAAVVTSITELEWEYAKCRRTGKTCYAIISKEKARDGYMRRPAAVWDKRRGIFVCPDCMQPIRYESDEGASEYVDSQFFRRETGENRVCANCGSSLWTMLVPEQQSEWVKITDYGFLHRRRAAQMLETVKKESPIYTMIEAVADEPDGFYPNAGAYSRFALSTYVKRHMKGKLSGLIVDEIHNYNNNSGQGDAMGELFQAAEKVIGLTATLINGYSSGIFHLLYRVTPQLMLKDDKPYTVPAKFNEEYGVIESIYELDEPGYNKNRRTRKRKVRDRLLPGVSPLVYSRFLMDSAAFLSLSDMGKDLPEYEEIPIQLKMKQCVADEYERIEYTFRDTMRQRLSYGQKVMPAFLQLLTEYPDQPYDQKAIVEPLGGNTLITPKDTSSFDELNAKDLHLLEIVEEKTANGGRVLVYTSWISIDTQQKLSSILTERGYRVAVLKAAVSPAKREEWLSERVSEGVQVLITNPSLVETGLDLNDFTTLFYYNVAYNLFTLRQSSRRSWRINQKAPRIEVYFAYYEGTVQQRAIRLMASKMAVAGIIEGNFTDEGLAAMSDCADMTTALARELTLGIKNEVEDLSAVFKKMAIVKSGVQPKPQAFSPIPDDFDPFAEEGFIICDTQVDLSKVKAVPIELPFLEIDPFDFGEDEECSDLPTFVA